MSVTSIHEIWEGRNGASELDKLRRTYTRVYRAICDSNTDNHFVVASACPVAIGDGFPSDATSYCKSISSSQDAADPLIWIVTVQYDSVLEENPDAESENPLDRPAVTKVTFAKYTKAVQKDRDDKTIKNSAGMPYDPPLEIDQSRPVVTITKNLATFDLILYNSLVDKVNDDLWNGFAAGEVKLAGVEAEQAFENDVLYWHVTWNLECQINTKWNPTKVLDAGFHYLDDAGHLNVIRDRSGAPVTSPVLLDGDGDINIDTDPPVYLEFNMYQEGDFSSIPTA